MKYDDWYTNLPLYKKENMQNELNFEQWDMLSEAQKYNVYNNKLNELYIDGPVEFYIEEQWEE
jgi:hypothetical protein